MTTELILTSIERVHEHFHVQLTSADDRFAHREHHNAAICLPNSEVMQKAWEAFTETVVAASRLEMLEMVGGLSIPDAPEPDRIKRPCRTCDTIVQEGDPGVVRIGQSLWCPTCAVGRTSASAG